MPLFKAFLSAIFGFMLRFAALILALADFVSYPFRIISILILDLVVLALLGVQFVLLRKKE